MNKKNVTVPLGAPMDARIIYPFQIQQLEGKILTFLESLGLRESQEKSAKDMFKDIFYRIMYFDTEYIGGDEVQNAIREWTSKNGQRGERTERSE